ncbi:hypothetical protein V6N12_011285 [Hibiscus sabdariffa]|uniref:Uncharacterized protein n=1 Tax=Hibiscus sabdariffa TaxID=183260 RepID=A0ABR2EMJ9_9ROSI
MSWNSICPTNRVLPLWKMAFFPITWSIWMGRNELVFRGRNTDPNHLFDIILLRLGLWSRAKWQESLVSITDFMINPKGWCMVSGPDRRIDCEDWSAPPCGYVKFNTDGAVM